MKNYIFVYFNSGMPENASPDAIRADWGNWFGALGESVVDPGSMFGNNAMNVTADRANPAPEGAATGYTIIKAETMDAAVALSHGCPVLTYPGGAVHVYESQPM